MATDSGTFSASSSSAAVEPDAGAGFGVTITMMSNDGREFTISKSAAAHSLTLRSIFDEEEEVVGGGGGDYTTFPVPNVNGSTMETVVAYLNGLAAAEEKFDGAELIAGAELAALFEIATAANYLNIAGLLDCACRRIADIIKDKSVRWVRTSFGVENDFTAEEEEELRSKYAWAHDGIEDSVVDGTGVGTSAGAGAV